MKSLRIVLVLSLLLSAVKETRAQSLKQLEELTEKHQTCLDAGVNMRGCSQRYYIQVDSLLNLAYNRIHSEMTLVEKQTLEEEQLAWLKKRDLFFRQQNQSFQKDSEEGEWGADKAMISYSNKASFVKERFEVLLKQACE